MADNKINVGGRLHSIATGNVLAGANEILDDSKNKKQSDINAETDAALEDRYTKEQTYSKPELNNLITTPNQQYVSVTANSQTTTVTDVLPATGAANTVYRVGNWDGSQFDASVYSEYAWNGNQYVHLSTKTKIGEVFDISAYHATGGTLATYADLSAALDFNNGGGVPQSLQKGGMSIKFVQSSDNKYVRYNLLAQSFTTDTTQWAIDNVGVYVNNPEYIKAETDAAGHLLFWIRIDGSVDWAIGVPKPIKDYVDSCISEIRYGNERNEIDGLNKIIAFLDAFSTSDTLAALLNTKVDKETGKSLINKNFADNVQYIENPEYIKAECDADGKFLGGYTDDGKRVYPTQALFDITESPEWKKVTLDKDGRVLKGIKVDNKEYDYLQEEEPSKLSFGNVIDLACNVDIKEYINAEIDAKITLPRAPLALMEPGQPLAPRIEDPSLPVEQQRTIVGYRRCRMPAITMVGDKIVVYVTGYLDGWKEKYDEAIENGWVPPAGDDWRWDDYADSEGYILVYDTEFNIIHSQVISNLDFENYKYYNMGQPVFVSDIKNRKTYMAVSSQHSNTWHQYETSILSIYSTSDGITWALEKTIDTTQTIEGYHIFMTSATKGLRLPNDHLIIPGYTDGGQSPVVCRSGYIDFNSGDLDDYSWNFVTNDLLTNECTAFFSQDGNIVISSRSGYTDDLIGGNSTRIIQQYKDGVWQPYWGDKYLYPIPGCQESWIRGLQTIPSPNGKIIFRSACDDPVYRKRMTLWASADECLSFKPICVLDYSQTQFDGYSDLIGDSKENIYFTHEIGYWGADNNNLLYKISIKTNNN